MCNAKTVVSLSLYNDGITGSFDKDSIIVNMMRKKEDMSKMDHVINAQRIINLLKTFCSAETLLFFRFFSFGFFVFDFLLFALCICTGPCLSFQRE